MSIYIYYLNSLEELFIKEKIKSGIIFRDDITQEDIEDAIDMLNHLKLGLSTYTINEQKQIRENICIYQSYIDKYQREELFKNIPIKQRTSDEISKDSLNILEESQRQLNQIVDIATETHEELKRQTEIINNSTNNLKKTNDDLSFSNKLINRMGQWWRS